MHIVSSWGGFQTACMDMELSDSDHARQPAAIPHAYYCQVCNYVHGCMCMYVATLTLTM